MRVIDPGDGTEMAVPGPDEVGPIVRGPPPDAPPPAAPPGPGDTTLGLESLDPPDWHEAGPEPDADEYETAELEAQALDAGETLRGFEAAETLGSFEATAYGPPWGGIQGTGVTATGVNLRDSPHLYIVAVDPATIALHTKLTIRPNPFGDTDLVFSAEDTGGAIRGRRLDFYDWRGRAAQNGWGRRSVSVARFAGNAGRYKPGQIVGVPFCGSHSPAASCWLGPRSSAKGCAHGDAPCNWQSCNACDAFLYPGAKVTACRAGRVSTRFGYGLMAAGNGRFAGYRLHVEHTSGMVSFYTHLRQLVARPGDRVQQGDLLGYSGIANGLSHLHFAVTLPFDPAGFVKAAYRLGTRNVAPGPQPPPGAIGPLPAPAGRKPQKTVSEAWNSLVRSQQRGKVEAAANIRLWRKETAKEVR